MTRRCELTGKLPMAGQLRSHAENKTKRTFRPNLCNVTLLSDALKRSVRLRISAHALRSVIGLVAIACFRGLGGNAFDFVNLASWQAWLESLDPAFAFLLILPFVVGAVGLWVEFRKKD